MPDDPAIRVLSKSKKAAGRLKLGPGDFDHDPCTWYWYKDPADIPDEHWERYGLERER